MDVEAEPRSEELPPLPQARRRRRTAVPLAIAIVLLAELAVRAAAPALREPLLWPGWEAQNKAAAIDALARRGGASVVFLGSSIVNSGLNPTIATRLLQPGARPAFNAALNGSDLRATSLWTRGVVVPRLRPDVVVIGFNSGEWNDRWEEPGSLYNRLVESHYGRKLAGTGTALERIDGWLIDRSYLVRYRSVLRRPVDALLQNPPQRRSQAVDPLGRLRFLDIFHRRPYTPGLSRQLGIWDRVFRDYAVGGRQEAALNRLVRDLVGRGIRVVLVRMPVTRDVVPLHPRGEADREAFGRALAAFVATHPVTFLDAEAAIGGDTALFVDPLHLNAAGERRATALVMERLRAPG